MPWSCGFVLGLPPRGGFWKQSKWPWNMVHLMPCRIPCRLYNRLTFIYSIGPSSIVWSVLGPAPPFPQMRVLEVQWSRALNLVCEVALIAGTSNAPDEFWPLDWRLIDSVTNNVYISLLNTRVLHPLIPRIFGATCLIFVGHVMCTKHYSNL